MDLEKLHSLNNERRRGLAELAAIRLLSPEEINQSMNTRAEELAQRHKSTMERMAEVCMRMGLYGGKEGKAALMLAFVHGTSETLHAQVDNSQSVIEVSYFVTDLTDTTRREQLDGYETFDYRFGGEGTPAHVTFYEGSASWASWRDEDVTLADKEKVLAFAGDQVRELENTSRMLLGALVPPF
jgi:hypothetical protein